MLWSIRGQVSALRIGIGNCLSRIQSAFGLLYRDLCQSMVRLDGSWRTSVEFPIQVTYKAMMVVIEWECHRNLAVKFSVSSASDWL
jgi:hypothetical protein